MLEILLFSIYLLSPADTTSTPFEITIIFENQTNPESTFIFLDGKKIEGEMDVDYFYKKIYNIGDGIHEIKIKSGIISKRYEFTVFSGEENKWSILNGNLIMGWQNSYTGDTINNWKNEPLYGMNLSFSLKQHFFSIYLLNDPYYYQNWYASLNYESNFGYLEGGYIYPMLNEFTLYSASGYGINGELNFKGFTFTPILLYTLSDDSLLIQYPRIHYGGMIGYERGPLTLEMTVFKSSDDTTGVTGIPLIFPKKSLVISPGFEWEINDCLNLLINGGYTISSENTFNQGYIEGNALSGAIEYEKNFNSIQIGLKQISSDYQTLGNPYLCTDRYSSFLNIMYENDLFYTNLDWLFYRYRENSKNGLNLQQMLKYKMFNFLQPVLEYQWMVYPEYGEGTTRYLGAGLDLYLGDIEISSLVGINREIYADTTTSFSVSTYLYFYPYGHSIEIGGTMDINEEDLWIQPSLNLYLQILQNNYLEISYYPDIEDTYNEHSLRISFDYGF